MGGKEHPLLPQLRKTRRAKQVGFIRLAHAVDGLHVGDLLEEREDTGLRSKAVLRTEQAPLKVVKRNGLEGLGRGRRRRWR